MAAFSQFWQKIGISIKHFKKTRGSPAISAAHSLRNTAVYICFWETNAFNRDFLAFSFDSYLNFLVNKSHHGDNRYFHVNSTSKIFFFWRTIFRRPNLEARHSHCASKSLCGPQNITSRATFGPRTASLTPLY